MYWREWNNRPVFLSGIFNLSHDPKVHCAFIGLENYGNPFIHCITQHNMEGIYLPELRSQSILEIW